VWGGGSYDTTQTLSSGTHYSRDGRVISVYGIGRPYTYGNTMTQDQFVKSFKPVSTGIGLVSG
jgi:hypothetical protein